MKAKSKQIAKNTSNKDNSIWKIGEEIASGSKQRKQFTHAIDSLTSHALICGNTGSGKTNTCFNLLEELWSNGIPFLVVEPAKTEYRHLVMNSKELSADAKIYTLGDESIAPFRINPFEIGPGVSIQGHIDALLSIFNSSFEMYAPMPQVLNKAICTAYESRGWNLLQNRNLRLAADVQLGSPDCPQGIFPTVKDLYDSIDSITESFAYSERIGPDVKAALKARVGDLLMGSKSCVFANRSSGLVNELFNAPCFLELGDKFNSCEKSFLTGVLMLFLYEQRRASGTSKKLKHVLLLEDAHRLLKRETRESFSKGAFTPMVSEIFVNLLSESSSYGQGIVISAQNPASLPSEVLSNTNLKIVQRLLTMEEIDAVAPRGYLSENQVKQLVALNTGDALAFDKGMSAPSLVKIEHNFKSISLPNLSALESAQSLRNFLKKKEKSEGSSASVFSCRSQSELNESEAGREYFEAAMRVTDDPLFRMTFNRYFLSVISDITQIVHFRAQIIHEIQRILGRRVEGESLTQMTWCCLVLASERYFERKGEEHYWSFEDVDTQKRDWLNFLEKGFQPAAPSRRISEQVLNTWRTELLRAQERFQGPLPGCGPCKHKCYYHFEVAEVVRDPKIRFDFNSAINRGDEDSSTSAAWFCQLLSERLCGEFNIELAYCLAVQFIEEQALSTDAQLVLLHKVRTQLETMLLEASAQGEANAD